MNKLWVIPIVFMHVGSTHGLPPKKNENYVFISYLLITTKINSLELKGCELGRFYLDKILEELTSVTDIRHERTRDKLATR